MRPELDFVHWRAGVGQLLPRLSCGEGVSHMRARIEGFPLFRPEEYLELSPDLKGLDPLIHYSEYGVWEPHRRFVGEKTVAAWLGEVLQSPLPAPQPPAPDRLATALSRLRDRPILVLVSSHGRWTTGDLAEGLAADLVSLGLKARVEDESADEGALGRRIFVAPHEFFTQGRGADWVRLEGLRDALMYVTEPVEAPDFAASVPYLLAGAGVVSPHAHVCALAERSGLPALVHVPADRTDRTQGLPAHPLARALPRTAKRYELEGDVWAERPLDLVFSGPESAVRDEFFGINAGLFAGLSCVIDLFRQHGSPQRRQPGEARPALRSYLARRTRMVLNLPQEELTSIDWNGMVLGGIAHRALVVSTPCLPHPLFKPGTHYLEESRGRLPQLIEWLLQTPDGRITAERVRHQAYAAMMDRCSPLAMAGALAVFLADGEG